MSNSAGLFIGRSFLELSVKKGTHLVSRRIAYSINSLDTQLKALIALVGGLENSDVIKIITRLPWLAIEKRLGTTPAFITTSGLENWVDLNLPLGPETWSVALKRNPSPLSKENVFGLGERSSAKGIVETEPTETDLEFLVSKLKLNEVTDVALGFLHSSANPANENKAADYFRANGFHVYASHETSSDREERPRFLSSILSAYIDPFLKEKMELVLKVITDSKVQPEVVRFGQSTLLEFLAGPRRWLADDLQTIPAKEPFLYCGIDDLKVVGLENRQSRTLTPFGGVGVQISNSTRLSPSLLSKLEMNFFELLDWSDTRIDIEPGPICLGRALVPTLIDAIASENDLSEIDGIGEKINEKTMRKVADAFKTYSRADGSTRELIQAAAIMWSQQLAAVTTKNLPLKGPMAPIVQKVLKGLDGRSYGPATLDFYMSESLI